MTSAYHFFLKHAGYSYGPHETRMRARIRNAQTLARAEREAEQRGVTFEVTEDDITNADFEDTDDPYLLLVVRAKNAAGNYFAALSGIDIGDWRHMSEHEVTNHPYLRVVKAELALELPNVDVVRSEN